MSVKDNIPNKQFTQHFIVLLRRFVLGVRRFAVQLKDNLHLLLYYAFSRLGDVTEDMKLVLITIGIWMAVMFLYDISLSLRQISVNYHPLQGVEDLKHY